MLRQRPHDKSERSLEKKKEINQRLIDSRQISPSPYSISTVSTMCAEVVVDEFEATFDLRGAAAKPSKEGAPTCVGEEAPRGN